MSKNTRNPIRRSANRCHPECPLGECVVDAGQFERPAVEYLRGLGFNVEHLDFALEKAGIE